MHNPNFCSYQPENDAETVPNLLNLYPEIQDLIDSFPKDNNTRRSLEIAFNSTDQKYGRPEDKLRLAMSGKYTGVYSPEYQKWRKSPAFQSLLERTHINPFKPINRERMNQAEVQLGYAKARLDLITKEPGLKKDSMEDARLQNEVAYWQELLDNDGIEAGPKRPTTQSKTERRLP